MSRSMTPLQESPSSSPFTANNNSDDNSSKKALLVPCTEQSLLECAKRIQSNDLVSFPTETVYGLGCNALSETAILKVFHAKRRPLTDPLIVHVLDSDAAMELWDVSNNSSAERVLRTLSTAFFPGPLTLVARCRASLVPPSITAGTQYVAARSPSHPIARKLIELSGLPIAAPSANRFGHVSPTRAEHVWHDLHDEDVWIVEGDDSTCVCDVGVESTVAKVDDKEKRVTVLRQGAISAHDIRQCLEKAGLAQDFVVDVTIKTTSEQVANIAPGQTVRHYSPDVLSFMIHECLWNGDATTATSPFSKEEMDCLSNAVVLDFGRRLHLLEPHCLAYRDLSPTCNSTEAASKVFDYLRWAESEEGAQRVYFPELPSAAAAVPVDALTLAVKDRLTRAASGVVLDKTLR